MNIYYILINTEPLKEHHVYTTLKKLSEVVEVHPLFGEYDQIVKIEADDEDIGKLIINKIRTIDGVLTTKTLTGMLR